MYLKSLEMQGFKSFPDKTKLIFEQDPEAIRTEEQDPDAPQSHGVTVIVGPNGSGKSNIADAMRWVLGEISSKTLRGTKMEDVIFGGADSRRPMGYSEVSVTFDNRGEFGKLDCPYDEVTVTRRYYRAGDSEYFINRKGVRLKDIYELFMNTGIGRDGYSIIGQGRIAEMVSRKSEERRSIFEDASGIAKYRYKKNDAERKLKDTEDNMSRVNDIFLEVSSQVGPLQKEAEKAKRAIELMDQKKRADVSLWLYDTEKLRGELTAAEEAMQMASVDLQEAEDSIQSLEVQNSKLFEASQGSKMESEELLTQIQAQTENCHQLESEYRVAENTVNHAKDLIAATQGSVGGTEKAIQNEMDACKLHAEKAETLRADREEKVGEQERLQSEQTALEQRIETLDLALDRALGDIRGLEQEAMDVKVRISVLENAKTTDTTKNSSALTELAEYQKISEELHTKQQKSQDVLDGYDAEIASMDAAVSKLELTLEGSTRAVREAEEALRTEQLRAESIEQRIATFKAMEEHFDGYSNAVRYVMKQYGEGRITDAGGSACGTIYGPLSQLISVEDRYITAIEIALGANLQNIVVENENTAKAAMYALKRGEAGRATFFPLTSMKPSALTRELTEASAYAGYLGIADTLVQTASEFQPVLSSLLGKTAVFDTIDHATAMAKAMHYRVRAVTLDGQQINVGGSFTGGSVRTGNGILSRAGERKRLEQELEERKARISKRSTALQTLQQQLHSAEQEKYGIEERRELLSVLRNTESGHMEQIKAKRDANDTLLERLQSDMRAYELAQARYQEDLSALRSEDRELAHRISEMTDFRNEKSGEKGELLLRSDEISKAVTELYIRISELQKDIETETTLRESAETRLEELNRELLTYSGRINTQSEQIRITQEAMEANRAAFAAGSALLEQLNAKRSEIEKNNFEFERKLNELNGKLRERMNHKELVFREYTKCESKLNSLREAQDKLAGKLWEDYELTRADAIALGYPPVTKENRMEMISLQTDCKNRLRVMGHVDLDAVNKYSEIKTRYDYLNGQITDLEKARKELNGIIQQLEVEMKASFVDSFNRINENFGKVFAELFGGGSAELSLTDPENVLESGIEIKAAPPGKIIKSLMQLSGGEQAFIGVALFFAILQVNPSPFCILDEIEAALDEVNVERLAQYIKRYSHGTQFIMITHRRGTMSAADRLYGVTMPEHGISKVLMLDANDISKKNGEEWNGIFG